MNDGGSSVVSMNEYSSVVKRWFRVIVVLMALGAGLGTILLLLQPGVYTTEALVQVRPIISQSDDPNLETRRLIDVDTEVAIAGSQRVAELALALRSASEELDAAEMTSSEVRELAATMTVDGDQARKAMERVAVTAPGGTPILSFEAEAAMAATVRDLAQSTALAYLSFRRDEAMTGNAESRERLDQREEALVNQLDDLADDIRAVGDDEAQVRALAYADVSPRQQLTVIGTKMANFESLTIDPGVVLTDALIPEAPQGLPLYAGPVTGAALGLIVALSAVFLLDRNDDRLRSGRIELSALGVPMLGTAPVNPVKSRGKNSGASRLYPVNTSGSDAYRRLHGTLLFNLDTEDKTVVLVAGVNKASTATSVAANIGATAARAGRRTLIIGADLRNHSLANELGLPDVTTGLSDVILDGASLVEEIHPVAGTDNLSVLAAGTRLDQPTDVLQSPAFARLMAAVQADFELVVVEAPPVLKVADAVDASGLCDGSIVVVERGSDSRQAIAESVDQLRSVGSDIVGVVVADAN